MELLTDKLQRLEHIGVTVSATDTQPFGWDYTCARLERLTPHAYELRIHEDCGLAAAAEAMDLAFDDVVWDRVVGVKWYPALEGPDFRGYYASIYHGRVIRILPRSTVRPRYWLCADCGHQRVARRAPGGKLKCAPCGQITGHNLD